MQFTIRDNNPTTRQPKAEESTIGLYLKEKNGEVFLFGVDSEGRVDKLLRFADGGFYLRPDNGLAGLDVDDEGYVITDNDELPVEPEPTLTGMERVHAALDALKQAISAL